MIHFALFFFASLGFAMLCLARDRHQRDLVGRKLADAAATWLRRGGLFCLFLAYPVAGAAFGWAYGTVEWLGQLSAGASLTLLLLARLSMRRSS